MSRLNASRPKRSIVKRSVRQSLPHFGQSGAILAGWHSALSQVDPDANVFLAVPAGRSLCRRQLNLVHFEAGDLYHFAPLLCVVSGELGELGVC